MGGESKKEAGDDGDASDADDAGDPSDRVPGDVSVGETALLPRLIPKPLRFFGSLNSFKALTTRAFGFFLGVARLGYTNFMFWHLALSLV